MNKVIIVYHQTETGLTPVALINTEDPEEAFSLTNHGTKEDNWTNNQKVLYLLNDNLGVPRSTSVGDILYLYDPTGKENPILHIVDPVGFTKLPVPSGR